MASKEPKDTSRPGFLAYRVTAAIWLAIAVLSWFGARYETYGQLAAIGFVFFAGWWLFKAQRVKSATAQTTQ